MDDKIFVYKYVKYDEEGFVEDRYKNQTKRIREIYQYYERKKKMEEAEQYFEQLIEASNNLGLKKKIEQVKAKIEAETKSFENDSTIQEIEIQKR